MIFASSSNLPKLIVEPISAFSDNYIWLIRQLASDRVVVVDPGDAQVVLDFLSGAQLKLSDILLTHKHHDHIGGVAELINVTGAKVHAPMQLDLVSADCRYGDMDSLVLFDRQWQVREIPGHTNEHIMYYCEQSALAFVGDTIFAAGCGRIFEGTPQQMYQSLLTILQLPEETKLYPAHEYTLDNLIFALKHDPDNQTLNARYQQVKRLRECNKPSLPTTIAEEKATNPFCRVPQLRSRIEQYSNKSMPEDWQVFAFLRHAKDIA